MPNVGMVASSCNVPLGPQWKANIGVGFVAVAGTTLLINLTTPIAVDDMIIVRVAADNLSATTPTMTVSDPSGNTYSQVAFAGINATAAAGVVGGLFACTATSAVAAGQNITVTFSGSVAHKAGYAESFLKFSSTPRAGETPASGASSTPSVTSVSASTGDLVIGMAAVETRFVPSAYDSDTSNGSWSTGFVRQSATSGTDNLCVEAVGQWKIVTGAGTQTYNITAGASTDWVAHTAVFAPIP